MRREGPTLVAPAPTGVEPPGSDLAGRMVALGCDAAAQARRLG